MGLLTGASFGVIMPLWTTLSILIGFSCWDIYAVLHKRGPIKELMDIVSNPEEEVGLSEIKLKEKIKSGEYEYDTSKLHIGIGDLVFYSMLTSSALVQSNNLIVMILTTLAIIIGTGITITGLKRNKVLPGLPISIFLGIGTMLLSWFLFSTFLY
jgi:presenilin-like A22 family membrane protease